MTTPAQKPGRSVAFTPSRDFREEIAKNKPMTDKRIDEIEADAYGGKPIFCDTVLDLIEEVRRGRRIGLQIRLPGTKK